MWWFTADLHLDHVAMLKHRPFKTTEEMNETLISNWNKMVSGTDVIVVAGDFCLHYKFNLVYNRFIRRLTGNIIWIRGNHDYWDREKRYIFHRKVDGQFLAISHYPMRTWKNSIHGSWNLHGHSHAKLPPYPNQLDIGVDNAYKLLGEYRPFSLEDIKQHIKIGGYENGKNGKESEKADNCSWRLDLSRVREYHPRR